MNARPAKTRIPCRPGMRKDVIAVNVDGIDPYVLAAAGLREGEPAIAEPTERGLLLRPATGDELDRTDAAGKIREVAARYPQTLERLGS